MPIKMKRCRTRNCRKPQQLFGLSLLQRNALRDGLKLCYFAFSNRDNIMQDCKVYTDKGKAVGQAHWNKDIGIWHFMSPTLSD